MSDQSNWRADVDAGTYFLHEKKQSQIANRRPTIRKASDLVGPGIQSTAVRLADFNDRLATYNGFFASEPGGSNAPNAEDSFVGLVVVDSLLGGWQQFRSLDTGFTYERLFTRSPYDPDTIFWGAWTSNEPEPPPDPPALYWSRFTRSTDQSITSGGSYVVPWEARASETGFTPLAYSGTNITIPKDGLYLLNAEVDFTPGASTQRAALRLRRNGTQIDGGVSVATLTTGAHALQAGTALPLAVGNTISLEANAYASSATLLSTVLTIVGPLGAAP